MAAVAFCSQGEDLAPPRIEFGTEAGSRVCAEGACGPGEGHPPWFTNGRRPARHGKGQQMRHSFEAVEVGDEELPTPHRPVGPVPETVEGDAEHGAGMSVLGQAGGDVGVVMLDRPRLDIEIERVLGRQVLGVQVVGDNFRRNAEQPAEVNRRLPESLIGGEVLQVTDVMAAHDEGLLGHRDRVLELGTDGENLARGPTGERQGLRGVAAGPPHHLQTTPSRPHDRIVAADMNPPVVCQNGVDKRPEAGKGVVVAVGDGVIGLVAAAHHEGPCHLGHEQVVQGRVRKHQSQVRKSPARRRLRPAPPACARRARWAGRRC